MKKSEFVAMCGKFGVAPSVALESDEVRAAIAMANTYPDCMKADAIAYVEDVMSAQF